MADRYWLFSCSVANTRKDMETILVVDDDPVMLWVVTNALTNSGYQVMVAQDGAAGLEMFLADPYAVDLIITDLMMPFLNGIEMVEQIKAVRPQARIVLMSAFPEAVISKLKEPQHPLIRKPFLMEDLIRVVRATIDPPFAHA